jgi:dipeptidyl aminopeptidase/acylaminoacyl peptidase
VFKGVVDSAVPDLESLVRATHHGLGSSKRVTLVGFSRGAGITALRAAKGEGSEPVVLVSGMYDGTNTIGSTVPGGEVDVIALVKQGAPWKVPALILHGTGDGAVPVSQAQALAAALSARGISVKEQYYTGAGHNLLGEPAIRDDVVQQMTTFVCAHFACPANS